jgi:hypothetical protein
MVGAAGPAVTEGTAGAPTVGEPIETVTSIGMLIRRVVVVAGAGAAPVDVTDAVEDTFRPTSTPSRSIQLCSHGSLVARCVRVNPAPASITRPSRASSATGTP